MSSRRVGIGAVAVGVLAVVTGVGLVVWPRLAGQTGPAVGVESPVTAMDLNTREVVTSPEVARDPTTPELVVAATRTDAPGPGCGLHISGDGGRGWRPVQVLDRLPDGVGACYAPEVGFDASGRLVFSFVGMAGPPPKPAGVWAVASGDHAQTFTQPVKLTDAATTATSLAVADDGGVSLAWLRPPEGQTRQDEGAGSGWPVGTAVKVASGRLGGLDEPSVVAEPGGLVAGPQVAAGPEGGVVVAYWQLPEGASTDEGAGSLVDAGPWRLMVARRGPDAEGFSEPVAVAERRLPEVASRPANHPVLVSRRGIAPPGLAAGGGRVCVSWTDTGSPGGLDAKVACSDDAAFEQWSEPVELGAGLPGQTFQWLPQVAATDAGGIAVVFYHHRQDAEDGRAADVYYTTTRDPEAGFADPVRLSTHPSLPTRAPAPGWFGTRLGLHAGPHGAVAMWADSRSGIPRALPAQTIFAATASSPAGTPAVPGWVAVGLAAAGVVVAAGGGWLARRQPTHTPDETRTETGAEAMS